MAVLRMTALLALCLFIDAAGAQEKKKPLAIEDLYLMESVKSPTLFPKEEKLVYERVWIDAKTKQERHSLWLVTGKRENRKALEKGEPDGRSPVVSPDGQWIAFLSSRPFPAGAKQIPVTPPYSDAGVDLWMYEVKTGKVTPLGGPDRPWGRVFHDGFYGRVAFSPDSKKLVFVADDGKAAKHLIEVVQADQGEGYTGYRPAQVWVVELDRRAEPRKGPGAAADSPGPLRGSARRLTDDDIWYGDPQWSPDGKSLVVVANKTNDRESVRYSINKNFDLYQIDIATKQQTRLTTNPGPDVSPRWSPDGKQIAYLSSPRNGPHRDVFNLGVIDHRNREPKTSILEHHTSDDMVVVPSFPLPDDCWENEFSLVVRHEKETKTFTIGVHARSDRIVTPKSYFGISDKLSRLTPIMNDWSDDRIFAKREIVNWQSDDFKIQGKLTIPPPAVAKPPYKLIVYPHGGPHGRVTGDFDFTVDLFAAQGYAVFQPNFRGSTGYGKKFLDANRLDLGGGDMRDILTGIDKLVKDGKVDPKRQFVYGISYGGFMTSWLVGHTHQFRAAVAQNAVTDMNMMYGLSDLQSWTTWELGGKPWEQPERYRKHSPITYANKVKTPTLILHARDDRRCPLPMGKAFHQALLANGVETQLVIYPDEGHAIRQPRHREDVYRRVLAWFAKHDVK